MPKRFAVGFVVLLVACFPSVSAQGSTAKSPHFTVVSLVDPVTSSGSLAQPYKIVQTMTGTCTGSIYFSGELDCVGAKQGYLPCWVLSRHPQANRVICMDNLAWQTTVVEIDTRSLPRKPTTRLPVQKSGTPATVPVIVHGQKAPILSPWGVQLADGHRCTRIEAAGSSFRGQLVDYACYPDNLLLLNYAQTGYAQWRFSSAKGTYDGGAKHPGPTVRVVRAWFTSP